MHLCAEAEAGTPHTTLDPTNPNTCAQVDRLQGQAQFSESNAEGNWVCEWDGNRQDQVPFRDIASNNQLQCWF